MSDEYLTKDSNWLLNLITGTKYNYDYDALESTLLQLINVSSLIDEMPTAPDYESILTDSYDVINVENQGLFIV